MFRDARQDEERSAGIADAVILIGHGSLRRASETNLIRVAARLRTRDVAPLVEPCFLNYSRPTFWEAVEKCVRQRATRFIVQPYFLIAGKYVRQDLPKLVAEAEHQYPGSSFRLAEPFGEHAGLVRLATKRVRTVAAVLEHHEYSGHYQGDLEEGEQEETRQNIDVQETGLLMMAHGTPLEEANTSLYGIESQVRSGAALGLGQVAFMEGNQPGIVEAVSELASKGARDIVALPYFLHLGRHVKRDLPILLRQAQENQPDARIVTAWHLAYDPVLVDVVEDRIRDVDARRKN